MITVSSVSKKYIGHSSLLLHRACTHTHTHTHTHAHTHSHRQTFVTVRSCWKRISRSSLAYVEAQFKRFDSVLGPCWSFSLPLHLSPISPLPLHLPLPLSLSSVVEPLTCMESTGRVFAFQRMAFLYAFLRALAAKGFVRFFLLTAPQKTGLFYLEDFSA